MAIDNESDLDAVYQQFKGTSENLSEVFRLARAELKAESRSCNDEEFRTKCAMIAQDEAGTNERAEKAEADRDYHRHNAACLHAENEGNHRRVVELEAEVAALKSDMAWIRRKLKLPEDAQMFSGDKTIAGTLHVWEHEHYGWITYIKAHKCDDKQGEIARLTVRAMQAEAEVERLNNELRTARSFPHEFALRMSLMVLEAEVERLEAALGLRQKGREVDNGNEHCDG